MLNSKQRARLRSYASTIDATTIIGKDGLTDNVLEQIDKQLFDTVKLVLEKNMAERHIRGGIATKNKFKTQAF